jgi:hypothetical protein
MFFPIYGFANAVNPPTGLATGFNAPTGAVGLATGFNVPTGAFGAIVEGASGFVTVPNGVVEGATGAVGGFTGVVGALGVVGSETCAKPPVGAVVGLAMLGNVVGGT